MKIQLKGTSPLLMHSARTVNPLDPITKDLKRITSKRKKTDEDHEVMARIEFEASLYIDGGGLGPYIPAENIERCIKEAAKATKNGKNVEKSFVILDDIVPLEYKGPRTIEELWKAEFYDQRPVKVGTNRIIRTRPRFADWELEFEYSLEESILNADTFEEIVHTAGNVGLGDFRPRFGRFQVTIL